LGIDIVIFDGFSQKNGKRLPAAFSAFTPMIAYNVMTADNS